MHQESTGNIVHPFLKSKIGAVLFDLDHTLWDHARVERWALEKVCRNHNLEFEPFYENYVRINRELWAVFVKGGITVEKMRHTRFQRILEALGASGPEPALLSDQYLETYFTGEALIDGAIEVLTILRPRVIIGIITNGTRDTQWIKIGNTGMRPFVDFMITPTEAACCKPDPVFFNMAFEKTGLPREQIACIGDSYPEDIIGAANAGAGLVVWFNPGGGLPPEECEKVPHVEIRSLQDLPPLLFD